MLGTISAKIPLLKSMSARFGAAMMRFYAPREDALGVADAQDAEGVQVRRRMGRAYASAVLASCEGQRLGAGNWLKLVLCGRTSHEGSLFAMLAAAHTPNNIPRAHVVLWGAEDFRRGVDKVLRVDMNSATATCISELRGGLLSPRSSGDDTFPCALVTAEWVTPMSIRKGGCRSLLALLEMGGLSGGRPAAVLYAQGETAGDVREMIGHRGLEFSEEDCGRGITAFVTSLKGI